MAPEDRGVIRRCIDHVYGVQIGICWSEECEGAVAIEYLVDDIGGGDGIAEESVTANAEDG